MIDSPRTGQDRIWQLGVDYLRPSPENDDVYHPIDQGDPSFLALVKSIGIFGIKEPLVVTKDGYILSGHRRHAASKAARLKTVPCRVEPITRDDPKFLVLLREFNRQGEKTLDEKLREECVSFNPDDAYAALTEHRKQKATIDADCDQIDMGATRRRAAISRAKIPMLKAICSAIDSRRDFWPMSKRQVHYVLLNDPPLRHASKPDSRYANTAKCYKDMIDLTTRAVFEGILPGSAFNDITRPVSVWDVFHDAQDFIRNEFDNLFQGYYRDLMRSQPNHIEIVGEKNTLSGVISPIAAEYTIPLTLGRGFCSTTPRREMEKRFKASGKENLVILILSDFDPDGEMIAESFARSMRDDFRIRTVKAFKVALTHNQVKAFHLPPSMEAKPKSTNTPGFIRKYGGSSVYELEAVPEDQLQRILRDAIDSVIDVDAFNSEIDAERADAAFLETARQRVKAALAGVGGANE